MPVLKLLTNYQQRSVQIKNIKQTGEILMEVLWILDIGKVPRPKAGWTSGNYKYMGPYNPSDQQLEYNKDTGEITKWYVKPYNKVDEIAAYHDVCYTWEKTKPR